MDLAHRELLDRLDTAAQLDGLHRQPLLGEVPVLQCHVDRCFRQDAPDPTDARRCLVAWRGPVNG